MGLLKGRPVKRRGGCVAVRPERWEDWLSWLASMSVEAEKAGTGNGIMNRLLRRQQVFSEYFSISPDNAASWPLWLWELDAECEIHRRTSAVGEWHTTAPQYYHTATLRRAAQEVYVTSSTPNATPTLLVFAVLPRDCKLLGGVLSTVFEHGLRPQDQSG